MIESDNYICALDLSARLVWRLHQRKWKNTKPNASKEKQDFVTLNQAWIGVEFNAKPIRHLGLQEFNVSYSY